MANTASIFPALPLDEWEATKETLHRYVQIVGKIRLANMPRKNHWWFITLYVNSRGFTTDAMPYEDFVFEIQFNFLDHRLEVFTSKGQHDAFDLHDGLSVASFYQKLLALLKGLGIEVTILAKPYDLSDTTPFDICDEHNRYQEDYVQRFWRIMVQVDQVFKDFSGRFYGKTNPVHLYWHHMDLAVTRFSGKRGPAMEGGTRADKDAYSHEVISFGFWAGDAQVRQPAFYSYTYPSPQGLDQEPLGKPGFWQDSNGSPMAMLMYNDLRQEAHPKEALMNFLESAYQAGAKRAHWDVDDHEVGPI